MTLPPSPGPADPEKQNLAPRRHVEDEVLELVAVEAGVEQGLDAADHADRGEAGGGRRLLDLVADGAGDAAGKLVEQGIAALER